jgi:cysteine desulfurase
MHPIYLDNASTTKLDSEVLSKMQPYLEMHFGNASSIHSLGQQTKAALEDARESLAHDLGATPAEIFFTASGTESDNMALKGIALALMENKKHLLSSKLEHKAVLESLQWLQKKLGFELEFISHDEQGRLSVSDLKNKIRPHETALISIMHTNNELGTVNPIAEMASLAREKGVLFHTDAVQSAGKLKLNVNELGIDTLAIAAHKFHGPKGVGALYVRTWTPLEPLLHGGTHERNRRAGTENYAFAIGLAAAFRLANGTLNETHVYLAKLRELFLKRLTEQGIDYSLNSGDDSLPHILNLSFPIPVRQKLAGDVLLLGLDAEGLAVSSGSACTSGTAKPSHVLLALGKSEHEARASVRISFSKLNAEAEIEAAAAGFARVLRRLI